MLNNIWGFMILLGVLVAAFTGNMGLVTTYAIESAKDAVNVCITMLGIVSMWTGLMKIAEDSGLITSLSRKMSPLLNFLFPHVPAKSKARQYVATNIIANMLGIGWAATPAGLKAMKELQALDKTTDVASKSMCMFLIINMSSLQIVSVNIIAYRSQYGAENPSDVIGAGLIATLASTIIAIIFGKIFERFYVDKSETKKGGRC